MLAQEGTMSICIVKLQLKGSHSMHMSMKKPFELTRRQTDTTCCLHAKWNATEITYEAHKHFKHFKCFRAHMCVVINLILLQLAVGI